MMVNSNNNMTMAVLDYLGKAYVQSYANSIGMSHTVINHYIGCPTLPTLNTTSIGDITRVYEGVENGTLLNSNYRSAFYARMLNETNYQQKFQAYLCPIVNQEAAKLGKSSTVAQNFCNAVTWKAKGGDYVMGNPNGGNPLEFHGGLSNYGFPVKTTPGGAITSYKHWIWGTYIDHTVYSSSSNKTAISNARTNAQTAALIGPIDQALTTW
jgi:hypothetical protein